MLLIKTCRTKSVRMVVDKKWYFPATNNPLVVTTTVYKYFKHLVSAGNKGTFDVLRWNRRKWTAGSQLKPGVLGSVPSDCQIFTFLYVPLITWNMSLVYNNSQWLTVALEVPCTAQGLHQVRCTRDHQSGYWIGCVKKHNVAVTTMYTLKHIDWLKWVLYIMHHHSLHMLHVL